MRNKIFGGIGMVWGALIVLARLLSGPPTGSESYQLGTYTGVLFGATMFGVGLYAFLKKPAPPKP